MKTGSSPGGMDLAMTGMAAILVAGTLILPFAKGVMIGTGPQNAAGTDAPDYWFTVLDTTNLSLPLASGAVSGQTTYILPAPGSYPFINPDPGINQPPQ